MRNQSEGRKDVSKRAVFTAEAIQLDWRDGREKGPQIREEVNKVRALLCTTFLLLSVQTGACRTR